ncbi:MAG: hemolysin family protein [Alphaproteobacteria bacterium]
MPEGPDDAEPPQRSLVDRLARLVGFETPDDPEPSSADARPSTLRQRAKEFEKAVVGDVMTSRVDVAALEVTMTLEDVLKLFARDAHSRMPVYRDSLDEPLGFVHIKDVVAELGRTGWSAEALAQRPLDRLKRDILFVPQSMRLPDLLVQMQARRTHIALVVDEYGGIDGVVCLEDLVEEIVGDIADEHDSIVPAIQRCGRQVWDIDGLADIEDVERETRLTLALDNSEAEVDTIGGLVSVLAGRVPATGETIVHPAGPVFEVVAADPRRVMRVRLRATPKPAALADDKAIAIDRREA